MTPSKVADLRVHGAAMAMRTLSPICQGWGACQAPLPLLPKLTLGLSWADEAVWGWGA